MNDKAESFKAEFQALMAKYGVQLRRADTYVSTDGGEKRHAGTQHWLSIDGEVFGLGFLTKDYKSAP